MTEQVRLLLVEDNLGDDRLIREMLRNAPEMEILSVATLAAGLDKLGSESVDAVLLDLGLPDSQGLETLSAIRSRFSATPVVVLTGNNDDDVALAAVKAGAQDYLCKDAVDREQLVRAIRYARERARIERELRASEERLKRTHQELQYTTAQLIQTAKLTALGELTAGVAHELNQPLNTIKIIAQSILRYEGPTLPEGVREDIGEIVDVVKKMTQIVEHMSIFTRSANEFDKRVVDVNLPVRGALKFVAEQFEHLRIGLVTDLSPTLPSIQGDAVKLEQVFLNLITNARHSLEECLQDVKRLEIRSYLIKPSLDCSPPVVAVDVRDNGPGIPEHIREQIFLPFFTTKRPGKGTGLGLSISHKIVEEHGGRIELATSASGETVFTVVLPVESASDGRK